MDVDVVRQAQLGRRIPARAQRRRQVQRVLHAGEESVSEVAIVAALRVLPVDLVAGLHQVLVAGEAQ